MKRGFLGAVLLVASLGAVAADTKPVKDVEGRCTVSVPFAWSINQASGRSPDKTVSIVLVTASPNLSTLSEVRKLLLLNYKSDKVILDSNAEIEMQGTSSSGKPNFVRAVQASGRVCFAEIVYTTGAPADMKTIVETLKPRN